MHTNLIIKLVIWQPLIDKKTGIQRLKNRWRKIPFLWFFDFEMTYYVLNEVLKLSLFFVNNAP